MLAPDARHRPVRDMQLLPEFASAPMCRTVARLTLCAPLKDRSLKCGCHRRGQLTGVAAENPRQSFLRKALTPGVNEANGAIEFRADKVPNSDLHPEAESAARGAPHQHARTGYLLPVWILRVP